MSRKLNMDDVLRLMQDATKMLQDPEPNKNLLDLNTVIKVCADWFELAHEENLRRLKREYTES